MLLKLKIQVVKWLKNIVSLKLATIYNKWFKKNHLKNDFFHYTLNEINIFFIKYHSLMTTAYYFKKFCFKNCLVLHSKTFALRLMQLFSNGEHLVIHETRK